MKFSSEIGTRRTELSHSCQPEAILFKRQIKVGDVYHAISVEIAIGICGTAPTYTMLQAMQPQRGEILKYDQAIADDRTSCVSFASVAFYE